MNRVVYTGRFVNKDAKFGRQVSLQVKAHMIFMNPLNLFQNLLMIVAWNVLYNVKSRFAFQR